jgi:hypothetical protein
VEGRRADVPAGQRQRLVPLGPDLVVPARVVERVSQVGGQARLSEQWLDERPAADLLVIQANGHRVEVEMDVCV